MNGRNVFWLVVMAGALLWSSVAVADEGEEESELEVFIHEVVEGETAGLIALQHEVHINDLMEWNELASIYDIEPGMEIRILIDPEADEAPQPRARVHVVRSGDTFESIARRYGVRTSQVQRWNTGVDPRRIQIGQRIMLNIPGNDGRSISWGRANSGRLFNGVQMEDSPGLRVRNPDRSYGTERVVNLLAAAIADVRGHWPDAPKLVMGSLSTRNGGRLRPHRSHQSGRDADVTYYHRGNVELPDFRDMSPVMFDAAKNWHLFKTLIDTEQVQFIFVDYALQEQLYEYAQSIGYTEEELEPILQYPRARRTPEGLIRHARGHRNHFHIRFTCGPIDQDCR